jgi:hypothetical protein
MKIAELPEHVEPLIIVGDDNSYLTIYTCMSNEDTIELLRRSLHVLEMEQEQAGINLHLH